MAGIFTPGIKGAKSRFGKVHGGLKPDKPEKTAEMLAAEKRLQMSLDKETEEEEARLKAAARGSLGSKSLLGGQSKRRSTGGSRSSGGSSTSGGGISGGSVNRTGGPGSSRQ